MPGSNAYEAAQAFLEPIQTALSCVATAKITVSRGGRAVLDKSHVWTINDGDGARLAAGFGLRAEMRYRLIEDERNGPFRATTEEYAYTIDRAGAQVVRFHWHPEGSSPVRTPHLHLGPILTGNGGLLPPKHHLASPRMTFEDVVRWCIELGATPAISDWAARLAETENPHVEHRSWGKNPPARPAQT